MCVCVCLNLAGLTCRVGTRQIRARFSHTLVYHAPYPLTKPIASNLTTRQRGRKKIQNEQKMQLTFRKADIQYEYILMCVM